VGTNIFKIIMSLEVRKKERETSQSLVRRFTKSIQQSGILVRARKTRFRVRKKSDDMQKKAALRRIKMKKEYEILKKLGRERE
jgi:hypothetical protein